MSRKSYCSSSWNASSSRRRFNCAILLAGGGVGANSSPEVASAMLIGYLVRRYMVEHAEPLLSLKEENSEL
jgi:hypothetical protein